MTQREPQDPVHHELAIAAARAGSKNALAKAIGVAPETLSRKRLSAHTMGRVRRYLAMPEEPDPVEELLQASGLVLHAGYGRGDKPEELAKALVRMNTARVRLLNARDR